MRLETELDRFLLRVVPGLAESREGADADEIDRVEILSGRELPPFYVWFLSTMGRGVGTFSNGVRDLSVATVIDRYRKGAASSDARYLMIGVEPDDVMPMQLFLDLDRPAGDDAMVLSRPVGGAGAQRDFESLREMLAWSAMRRFRVLTASQRCRGKLSGERGRVMPELRRILRAQGFEEPVSTGERCGLFERADAALTATVSPGDDVRPYLFFEVGAPDSVTLRQVLGVLATESSLGVEVHGWEPPLP